MESSVRFNKSKYYILCIDDSDGSHKIVDFIIKSYAEARPGFRYEIDHFYSYAELIAKKRDKYDLEIIDWNLGPSIQDRGDHVVKHLGNNRSDCTIIYTGMTHILSAQNFLDFVAEYRVIPIFKGAVNVVMSQIHGILDAFLAKK